MTEDTIMTVRGLRHLLDLMPDNAEIWVDGAPLAAVQDSYTPQFNGAGNRRRSMLWTAASWSEWEHSSDKEVTR